MIKNLRKYIESNKENVYECGSTMLRDYLISNKIVPIGEYVHTKSDKVIYVFVKSDKLSELLSAWTDSKPPNLLWKGFKGEK